MQEEEKKIAVGFNDKEPMSFEEAANFVHEKASKPESEIRAEAEKVNYPINDLTAPERIKFLNYCISLCEKGNRPNFVAFLRLKVMLAAHPEFTGCSRENVNIFIAHKMTRLNGYQILPMQVDALERDAVNFVKDQITTVRETHIPIVGGV